MQLERAMQLEISRWLEGRRLIGGEECEVRERGKRSGNSTCGRRGVVGVGGGRPSRGEKRPARQQRRVWLFGVLL
jgi:hypothetical protein